MSGRRISKSSHRMSGEVYVVGPVPSDVKLDETLSKALERDRRAIDELKRAIQPRPSRRKSAPA